MLEAAIGCFHQRIVFYQASTSQSIHPIYGRKTVQLRATMDTHLCSAWRHFILTINIPDALVSLGNLPSPIPSVLSFSRLILWTGAPQAQGAITMLDLGVITTMGELTCRGENPTPPSGSGLGHTWWEGLCAGDLNQAGRVCLAGQRVGEISTHLALGPAGRIALAQNQVHGQFT